MPLKIVPPRHKKARSLYIRGSYLGVAVDQSARTDRPALARKVVKRIEAEIERGEYKRKAAPDRQQPTFIDAAINYLETGHTSRYVQELVEYFKDTPLSEIDQAAIDQAAVAIKPNGTPMNRCAAVHTPVSAILHFAGVDVTIRRPKGWQGKQRSDWLTPDDAFGIIAAADSFDPEFGTLLTWLLYTGSRIGAALDQRREDVRLDESRAWARSQKGQPHMDIRLHPDLRDRLAALFTSKPERQVVPDLPGSNRRSSRPDNTSPASGPDIPARASNRIFRLHYGAHLVHQLVRAKLRYLGIPCPKRCPVGFREPPNRLSWVTFHSFRHTFASWMRTYSGASIDDLLDTGNWRNEKSARRYVHAKAEAVWDLTQHFPKAKKVG